MPKDSASSSQRIDQRPLTPDTVDEWMQKAEEKDVVVMLEADEQTVFVAKVESDEFDRGYRWKANSIAPDSGARSNSFSTHENLVKRWFTEAVPRSRAWTMDWDETPLERDSDV